MAYILLTHVLTVTAIGLFAHTGRSAYQDIPVAKVFEMRPEPIKPPYEYFWRKPTSFNRGMNPACHIYIVLSYIVDIFILFCQYN